MNFLNKMERKFGRFAIPNLTFWLIGAWVLGFIIQYTMPDAQNLLVLEPYLILKGQVWRLVSWILIPPAVNILFLIFFLSCYYFIGTSIEQAIGTFRYNVYLFGGLLFTLLGAFLLYVIYWLSAGIPVMGIGSYFGTEYVTMSLFLALASNFPNVEFRLYFILPFKAKWLGIVDAVWMIFSFIVSNWAGRVAIIASLLNFLIFFFSTRNFQRISPREIHRKQVYRQQMRQSQGVTKHKCAICGRTEQDGAELEFRFCSKCEGNYEYCQDHLFTHQHIKRS